jgi:hypothetical protein
VLNPCRVALGDHLRVDDDGSVVAMTREGEHVIDAFNLNYSVAKEYRKRKIDAFTRWKDGRDEFTIEEELAFPDDLPQLDDRRCLNRRPEGIAESYFSRRQRGRLPTTY